MRKRRRLLMVIVSVVCVFGLAASSEAAIVTLDITGAGGSWQVYADVSLDSEGLASMGLDVTADGGLAITGSSNETPISDSGFDLWGFYSFRADGANGIGIDAGQPTLYSGENDPTKDARVLQGIGQVPGNQVDPITQNLISWDAHVLLASGTYSGSEGTLYVSGNGNTLDSGSPWTGPGHVSTATWEDDSYFVPEPVTLAVLALGGLAALIRRR